MASLVPFNPLPTVNAPGSFNIQTTGFVAGTALDDPSARYRMRGGTVAASVTLPMYGGCGISELVPGASGGPNAVLGPQIIFATSVGAASSGQQAGGILTGFTVFDQDHAMVMTPQSPVPLAASGMQVNYYPLGSNARICVAIDPVLANLEGYLTRSLVSWDFVNQRLVPYVAAYASESVSDATWNSATGVITFTVGSSPGIVAGDDFTISGIVATSPGSNGLSYNGSWTAISGTSGTTITAQGVPGAANNPGTYSSGGTLAAGGGAVGAGVTGGAILPVQVLDVEVGNSMTVSYSSTTGFYTWNRSGSVAVIQI